MWSATIKGTERKSDRTRAAIARAARAAFAKNGYERTTIRQIAARAKIDPALVIRYFGSKEDLFARVAQIELLLPDLRSIDRDEVGEALALHYLKVWEAETGQGGLPVLLRSAASNERAAAHMRETFRKQVVPMVASIEGKGSAADRAALVASQLLGMALCRYVLKMPPLVAMPREKLVKEIGRTLQHYLTGE